MAQQLSMQPVTLIFDQKEVEHIYRDWYHTKLLPFDFCWAFVEVLLALGAGLRGRNMWLREKLSVTLVPLSRGLLRGAVYLCVPSQYRSAARRVLTHSIRAYHVVVVMVAMAFPVHSFSCRMLRFGVADTMYGIAATSLANPLPLAQQLPWQLLRVGVTLVPLLTSPAANICTALQASADAECKLTHAAYLRVLQHPLLQWLADLSAVNAEGWKDGPEPCRLLMVYSLIAFGLVVPLVVCYLLEQYGRTLFVASRGLELDVVSRDLLGVTRIHVVTGAVTWMAALFACVAFCFARSAAVDVPPPP